MKKNKRTTLRIISLLLTCVIVLSGSIHAFASNTNATAQVSETEKTGRLPVYCMDNSGNLFWLDVYVKENKLYVKSTSFAQKFGYLTAETDNSVQFLQRANKKGENYKWQKQKSFQ